MRETWTEEKVRLQREIAARISSGAITPEELLRSNDASLEAEQRVLEKEEKK